MQIANLSKSVIEKIKSYRYDRIIEKHEGLERWNSVIEYHNPEFIKIGEQYVLLPLEKEHHKNITILRYTIDKTEKTLTVFLKDTTYVEKLEHEYFQAGFVAVCDKVLGEDFL